MDFLPPSGPIYTTVAYKSDYRTKILAKQTELAGLKSNCDTSNRVSEDNGYEAFATVSPVVSLQQEINEMRNAYSRMQTFDPSVVKSGQKCACLGCTVTLSSSMFTEKQKYSIVPLNTDYCDGQLPYLGVSARCLLGKCAGITTTFLDPKPRRLVDAKIIKIQKTK